MLNIENARPTAEQILLHIEEFEEFCLGQKNLSPTKYREINQELSVGAVLMLGKHKFQRHENGRRLLWKGLDNREYDLGRVDDANVMRDYPGFNAGCSRALGGNKVASTKIINAPHGKKGCLSVVTMTDGTKGIGPNYRIAVRNAALKMHLKSRFNFSAMAGHVWKTVWGTV